MNTAVLVTHRPLGRQAQRALQYMIERGGLTRAEAMELGIANLPAEVGRIREALGESKVVTEMWPADAPRSQQHAVYRFRGLGTQTDLFPPAA